jgi:hypothetical protein
MTLIKIDKDRYVNSDNITSIVPRANESGVSRIYFTSNAYLDTTPQVVDFLAQMLDANDTFTDAQPTPETMTLQSRVAVYLRNQTDGVTFTELSSAFSDEIDTLQPALDMLAANNTVKVLSGDYSQPLYYHASNAIFYGPEETEF